MKKKALVLAVCMAFATPTISSAKILPDNLTGLNLGEVETVSFLNEPFDGFIPILFTDAEASKKLQIRLAPESVFQLMGAEKLPILSGLLFKIEFKNNKPVISIKSSRPIQIPFLNFVLEIKSPNGKVYQYYTTLLDPRNHDKQIISDESIQDISPQENFLMFTSVASSKSAINNKRTHTVRSGDTLSEIAQALNATEVSLKKLVNAIHKKNPKAFINNNINRLKAGSTLRIPTQFELQNSNFKKIAKKAINTKHFSNTQQHNEIPKDAYRVQKGDTLSEITKTHRHKGVSFTKMMSSIYVANPHAFSKSKINLLKAGKILRIPSLEEVSPSNKNISATTIHNPNLVILDYSKKSNTVATNSEFKLKGFVVEKGDTLAKITKQIGHKEISFPKMMKAIYLANPDAFEKNNITMLIEGAVIRLPSISEINSTEKNSIKNDTKPEIITPNNNSSEKQSEAANQQILINLEKRVRELKRDLGKANSNLTHMASALSDKEVLIKEQSQNLLEFASSLATVKGEKQTVPAKPSKVKKAKPVSIEEELLVGTNRGYIPANAGDQLTDTVKEYLANYSQYMSGKELISAVLALLFGLLLIRFRREIYSYTRISYDIPSYYPPFEESEARAVLKEKPITFHDTIVDIHDHKETPNFSNTQLQECETLVDELIENHDEKNNVINGDEEWDSLEKACDDYIAKYKEGQKTDFTNTDDITDAISKEKEMTFEMFEALAEGVISKDTNTTSASYEIENKDITPNEQTFLFEDLEAQSLKS